MLRFLLLLSVVFTLLSATDVNLDKAVNDAKKQNKHVLIFLHITGCSYCDKMIEFTFDDEEVEAAIQKDFLFIDMNVKDEGIVSFGTFKGSKMAFAKYIDYNLYPTSLFFDGEGELVFAQPGYNDEAKFMELLSFISTKAYNDID